MREKDGNMGGKRGIMLKKRPKLGSRGRKHVKIGNDV